MRNLKTLGPALVAAFALSAMAAATASASELFNFTSTAGHTSLSGASVGTHQLTADAGAATCESVSYTGTVSGEVAEEVAVAPEFAECTADPFGTATITMNGCQFVLTPAVIEGSSYVASQELTCEAGKSIKVEVKLLGTTKCTIHIPPQILGDVLVSEVSGEDITVDAEIEGIEYDQTAGTGFGACSTVKSTTNGTYVGHSTLNGGEAGLTLEPIPHTIKILTPIEFKNEKEKFPFQIESIHKVKVDVKTYDHPPGAKIFGVVNGCQAVSLNKQGDKCTMEIECDKKTGIAPRLTAYTEPYGADVVPVKNC